ncbi:Ulp1-like peptidase [Cucumis melo var. makuwa]|uniref:Ulp1-like peptidase n=1 Tax=Cucumis melo var. makuwa TaxID=1194695 RepID=A0A5D3D6V8_CUCMM|nr:Ulp1-like peptidase [Cucumis melo var. makuwa]TYK19298.1 Ulp1-like peptidase [Cucumis melo var. makuwa]
MKKAIRNLQDRVAVVEGQLTSIKADIDELKGMMSTILKHIGLQRKGDEGDRKGFEGLADHTLESEEVDNDKTEDVDKGSTSNWLWMPKEDDTSNEAKHIELRKKDEKDVHTIGTPPWLRFNIELEKPIDVLEKKVEIGLNEPIDVIDDEVEIEDSGKKLYALFLFIRFKIKATGILSAQNFTTADTIFMRILVAKLSQYKECIKENRPFDWKEEYRLVDYVVGSKEDFQYPWVWDSLPSLTTAEEMRNILLPIRELVPNLLDSTGFFARRGGSSTYKEPWPVVIVDSIPLQ